MKKVFFTILAYSILGIYNINAQERKNENELINLLITKKREYNKENGSGFRIQLYNGSEIRAKQTRAKFKLYNKNIKTYLKFQTPEWKIQIGNYKTKLAADRALLEYKNEFYSAIVVPIKK